MSRGLGAVQRALLARVEETWTDLRPELWLCVSTVDLGLGEHRESRRRAAHTLAAAGLVDLRLGKVTVDAGPESEGVFRNCLFARLPMGEASASYARELRLEYLAHLGALGVLSQGSNLGAYREHLRWIHWYETPAWRDDVRYLD